MSSQRQTRPPYLMTFVISGAAVLLVSAGVLIAALCLRWGDSAAQWVSAVGTWVGGLFTGGALLFAALQLSQEHRKQAKLEVQRERHLLQVARSCALRLHPATEIAVAGGKTEYRDLEITFTNKTDYVIQNIRILRNGKQLASAAQVNPKANPWGTQISLSDLAVAKIGEAKTLPESRWVKLIPTLKAEIEFQFEIEDLTFSRADEVTRLVEPANS